MTAILYAPFEKCADTLRPREQELEEQQELLQNDGVRAKGLTPSAIDHVCPLSCQKVCCDRRWSGAGGAFKSFYHLNGIWQKAGFIFIVSSSLFSLPPAVTPSLMWQQERHKTNHTKFVNVPCGADSLRAAPSSLQSIY